MMTRTANVRRKRREKMEFRDTEKKVLMGIVDQLDEIGEERIQRKTLVL